MPPPPHPTPQRAFVQALAHHIQNAATTGASETLVNLRDTTPHAVAIADEGSNNPTALSALVELAGTVRHSVTSMYVGCDRCRGRGA